MDEVLKRLRSKLPFGDFRTFTIRYTGIEVRQDPQTYCIEIGQENYIDSLEPVSTKALGSAGTPLKDAGILRTCAGQLAWVSMQHAQTKVSCHPIYRGFKIKAKFPMFKCITKLLGR